MLNPEVFIAFSFSRSLLGCLASALALALALALAAPVRRLEPEAAHQHCVWETLSLCVCVCARLDAVVVVARNCHFQPVCIVSVSLGFPLSLFG